MQIEASNNGYEMLTDVMKVSSFLHYDGDNEEPFLQIRRPEEAFDNQLFTQYIANEYELQSNIELGGFVHNAGEEGVSFLQIRNAEEAFNNYLLPADIEKV